LPIRTQAFDPARQQNLPIRDVRRLLILLVSRTCRYVRRLLILLVTGSFFFNDLGPSGGHAVQSGFLPASLRASSRSSVCVQHFGPARGNYRLADWLGLRNKSLPQPQFMPPRQDWALQLVLISLSLSLRASYYPRDPAKYLRGPPHIRAQVGVPRVGAT
jgi:hypothetical protein